MAPGDEPDRQVADRHGRLWVVFEHLERVVEEPLALADRPGQFVHPLTAARREQDRDLPDVGAGPRQEVPKGDEIDEVVGVKMPDHDGVKAARIADRHESADHALAAVDQDSG